MRTKLLEQLLELLTMMPDPKEEPQEGLEGAELELEPKEELEQEEI